MQQIATENEEKKSNWRLQLYILSSFIALNISDKYKYKWPKPDIFCLQINMVHRAIESYRLLVNISEGNTEEQIPVCYTEVSHMGHF